MQTLSIIIPAYNEQKTIEAILVRIQKVSLINQIQKEIIVVNDCSSDATEELVKQFKANNPDETIKIINHLKNQGKGSAIHTGIKEATGDFIIIQDADLEYNPEEYNVLLNPILSGDADVVYGSRFAGGKPHRILFFWHTIGNRFLTFVSNAFSNLNLSDMETCYKLFKSEIIKSLDLTEKRFGFEPEVTQKLARVKAIRIYEVGISYYGRTYDEGKKIGWKDGFRALFCILKYGTVLKKPEFLNKQRFVPFFVKNKLLVLFLFSLFLWTGFLSINNQFWGTTNGYKNQFQMDGWGYYQYLPAVFIEHDLVYKQPWTLILEDGKRLNKFTMGVAYLQLPFFLIANAWCSITGQPNDGYTNVHGVLMSLGALIYCFLALLLLFHMLRKRFNNLVAFVSVILLFYASNLVFYTWAESCMSHVYSFFLISVYVVATPRFYSNPNWKNTLLLAFPLAIFTLIRQNNIVVVLYLLLYGITSWSLLKNRVLFWLQNWKIILLFALVMFVVFAPQMYYWHLVTGKWYIYAYGYNTLVHEGLIYWKNPKIAEVLASPASGWLTYSPIFIIAVVGLVGMIYRKQVDGWAIFLSIIPALYVISSWWMYNYDCGFGHRGFIDYYGMLSIPLAYGLMSLFQSRYIWLKLALPFVFIFLMYVNIRLSMMYFYQGCWTKSNGFTWKNYGYVLKRAAEGGDYRGDYFKMTKP